MKKVDLRVGDLVVVTAKNDWIVLYKSKLSSDYRVAAELNLNSSWRGLCIVTSTVYHSNQQVDFVNVFLPEAGVGWLNVDYIVEVVK